MTQQSVNAHRWIRGNDRTPHVILHQLESLHGVVRDVPHGRGAKLRWNLMLHLDQVFIGDIIC